MKRFIGLLVLGLIWFGGAPPSFAASTSVDSLIRKLVDKGILTEKEALELKGEIASDEKLIHEEGFKQSLPSWIQDVKLKGDFRLRYQYERKETDADARERGRIRYRLGIETKINEKLQELERSCDPSHQQLHIYDIQYHLTDLHERALIIYEIEELPHAMSAPLGSCRAPRFPRGDSRGGGEAIGYTKQRPDCPLSMSLNDRASGEGNGKAMNTLFVQWRIDKNEFPSYSPAL